MDFCVPWQPKGMGKCAVGRVGDERSWCARLSDFCTGCVCMHACALGTPLLYRTCTLNVFCTIGLACISAWQCIRSTPSVSALPRLQTGAVTKKNQLPGQTPQLVTTPLAQEWKEGQLAVLQVSMCVTATLVLLCGSWSHQTASRTTVTMGTCWEIINV